ncbi:MAG: hypothetical protein SFV15_05800 [Polyangiaceae bacterium]|nr:hypothetical protein [Polyangiaceae bacterium]
MHELLILVVHLVLELVWNLITWFLYDLILSGRDQKWAGEREESSQGALVVLASAAVGAALGGISLLVWPHVLLKYSWLRLFNFVLAPVLAGLFASTMSRSRRERGEASDEKVHVWGAVLFTLSYGVVRFVWASRGAVLGAP